MFGDIDLFLLFAALFAVQSDGTWQKSSFALRRYKANRWIVFAGVFRESVNEGHFVLVVQTICDNT
ncbi:hypothetical protein PSDVSF_10010 [Pseudodesulfovibrio sediminis]|uniref:Secreted protein n=1 Tax=Pseudodesulfovibrio sediminis TaxID=2810563 RepID=A0ABN6ERR9_9BACT|nr:hypothetical protein PSDVSF_10010 [Pseudodesulfovibrio sediminis]